MAALDYISEERMSEYDALIKQYIGTEIGTIETFKQVVVSELPSTGESKTLYLVPRQSGSGDQYSEEYVWVEAQGTEGQSGYIPAHFGKVGSTEYIPDHTIEDKPTLNKLLVTLNPNQQNEAKFLVSRDPYTAPANPTFSPASGGSGDGSLTVTMSTTTSGASIQYSTDDGSTWTTGTSKTLSQDDSQESKSYTIKAKAVKNGLESSVVSASYTIKRKLTAPSISVDSDNKYAASHVVTISHSTADTLYYTTDGSDPTTSSPTITSGGTITLSTAGTYTVKVLAVKSNWVSNSTSKGSIIVGAKKCYIGQTESVTTAANVEALSNVYELDTLVGQTKVVTVASSSTNAQYVWFAIPNTADKNLIVTVNNDSLPTPVPLQAVGGSVIGSYRVWRSQDPLFNQTGSYDFKFT